MQSEYSLLSISEEHSLRQEVNLSARVWQSESDPQSGSVRSEKDEEEQENTEHALVALANIVS